MKRFPPLLISLAGSLLIATGLGAWGYQHIHSLHQDNQRLQQQLQKALWRADNLSKNQSSLETELAQLKASRERDYNQTLDTLLRAKAEAPVAALYEIGVQALQAKDYPRAYFALNQVQQSNPGYKALATHYPAAQKAYAQHQQQLATEKLKATYALARDQQAQGQWAQAQLNYQQVLALQANYQDAPARLATVSRQLQTTQAQQALEQHKKWLTATYQLGLSEQALGRYAQAQAAFAQIVAVSPQYKDSRQRLKTVSALVPKPIPTPALASTGCYDKGVQFGKCSSLGANAQGCNPTDMTTLQTSCKGDPEFTKGLKSVANLNIDSGAWLKSLDTLKNL